VHELCSDSSLTQREENETGAVVFSVELKEWKKEWKSMNWTEMGVRKLTDVRCQSI
jgi:hypothetical protein